MSSRPVTSYIGICLSKGKGNSLSRGKMTSGKNLDLKKIRKSGIGNGRCVVNIEEWGGCFPHSFSYSVRVDQ